MLTSDRRPLYISIADEIRNSILVGEFPAGTRLPSENELAARFNAARTSVREALRALASQGMVETTRGGAGGTVVLELGHLDVMRMLEQNMRYLLTSRGCSEGEMEEVRELLEVSATWMAASRRTPLQLDQLRGCIPQIDPGRLPTAEQVEQNLRFHYLILEATGNRLLHLFGEPVSVLIYSFYKRKEHAAEYYQNVLRDHRKILSAIEARDADAAREAMQQHFCELRSDGGRSPLAGLSFS